MAEGSVFFVARAGVFAVAKKRVAARAIAARMKKNSSG